MYLRTPKRYRPGRRRRLRLISARTVFFLILILGGILGGWLIWINQIQIRESVLPQIESRIENLAQGVQTQVAPRPTPTATPDLDYAQSGCINAYRQGNITEAIEQCTILADNSPNDVAVHYQVTHMLIITSNFGRDKERIAQALAFAEKTINADPETPHGWAIRAMALDWSGEYGRALASALQAKALDESFAPTYAFLGEIYHDLGQDSIALGYLDQALGLDTSGIAVANTFRNRGKLYSDQARYDEAIQPYQAALQQAPFDTYIVIELANNYVALGQIDTAIQVLAEALERNSGDPALLFALGNAYVRNGNKERAYEYYSRCLDTDRDNVLCLSYLGGLQWSDGDFVTAINNLEQAILLGSTDPDDFLQLGLSQAALGRCDLAVPYFQQGYQIVLSNQDTNRQANFARALQSCGILVNQPQAPTPDISQGQ